MTSRRVRTKAGVDKEEKRKNHAKRGCGQGGVAFPHPQRVFRFTKVRLSRLEEESRMAVRSLRAGQPLQESQAAGEDQSAVGPARV